MGTENKSKVTRITRTKTYHYDYMVYDGSNPLEVARFAGARAYEVNIDAGMELRIFGDGLQDNQFKPGDGVLKSYKDDGAFSIYNMTLDEIKRMRDKVEVLDQENQNEPNQ